ncbi:MAG: LPS export ABC transporter periplasmic protein LptC [Prevotellaceae bacterium]|jgi:LPS export ABC transporter protein LptC|nr:LPS export ABC transporter periplasmic protein LptC [Prevotellaceae bacterium]
MVALLIGATMLLSCGENIPRVEDSNEMSVQKTEMLRITYSSNGKIRYHITTPQVFKYTETEEPYEEFPQGGFVEMYNDSLVLETTIFAKYAIHHYKPEEIWMATDSVVVHNLVKGQSLYTDTLYWDLTKEEIYTDAFVKVITPDMILPSENGMRSDQQFRNYEFISARNIERFYDDSKFKSSNKNQDSIPVEPKELSTDL